MHDAIELSIVICTRNRASTLGGTLAALAEIRSAYAWEILIVDNASTDNTAEVIKAADDCGGRLQYADCSRIGLGAARDFAWRRTRGSIVAFTDDDCYPEPNYVDALVETFRSHPDVGVLSGRILLYDPDDLPMTIDLRTEPQVYAPRTFIDTGSFNGANLALRRAALEATGGFDPYLGAGTPFPCEDIDAAAAALWSGAAGRFDPRPLVYHHHRRRLPDEPGMRKSYDAGRGAYYAKYLLRPDSRWSYAMAWARRMRRRGGRAGFEQSTRELRSAHAYLRFRKANGLIAVAAPFALLALGLLGARAALGSVWRRIVNGRD